MGRIMIDERLRTKLAQFKSTVEVCDHEGKLLGHFVPQDEFQLEVRESDDCPYSLDELSRMRGVQGGRPLAEILADLEEQTAAAE